MPAAEPCFAVTAPGLESLTAAELAATGLRPEGSEPGGVSFLADLGGIHLANLELRTASRVLLRLAEFPARAFYELERKAKRVPWERVVAPGAAVRFRVTSRKSKLYHLDGIAERLAGSLGASRMATDPEPEGGGEAENAEKPGSGQLFVVRVMRDQFTISADASGELLHRRGYRLAGGKAPLRETLAAAILLGARYDGSEALMDPFAGSGTIPIEGALIARGIAPGLAREFAIEGWPSFDGVAGKVRRAALAARIRPSAAHPIAGFDRDEGALEAARDTARRAGVGENIAWTAAPLSAAAPPASRGLLASNPPYGVRIGEPDSLRDLYAALGTLLRGRWNGWRTALLSADRRLTGQLKLELAEQWQSSNGGLPVTLVTAP